MGKTKSTTKKTQTTSSRKTSTKAGGSNQPKKRATTAKKAGEKTVEVDRRRAGNRRSTTDRRKASQPVAVERRTVERRKKVSRRRQIDPTTCERDYSTEEVEFMNALDEYKRTSGRMFPTCSEILEVVRGLGYQKQPKAEAAGTPVVELTEEPAARQGEGDDTEGNDAE